MFLRAGHIALLEVFEASILSHFLTDAVAPNDHIYHLVLYLLGIRFLFVVTAQESDSVRILIFQVLTDVDVAVGGFLLDWFVFALQLVLSYLSSHLINGIKIHYLIIL